MSFVLTVVAFLLGICVGSFLNVCIYRIPEGISVVTPRSQCGYCHRTLKPYDMIPVLSYFLLGGKCRFCSAAFSVRYALIELLTGLLYVACFLKFGYTGTTFILFAFIALMIVVFFIDLDHMIIPNQLVLVGLILGGLVTLYQFFFSYAVYESPSYLNTLLGMIAGGGVMFAIAEISAFFYRGSSGLGFGDVKIFLVIGLFLGWRLTLLALWLSFVFGGVLGILLIVVLKKDRKMAIPFGPFIVIGTLVSLFFGGNITSFM
ncbi:prepilin peptidase [Fusibacter ferrireducens]|uniref:Prepilin leader peptidase/N-methyltransferase n=1 Tax=Fusibacter ferrireducens TaxID=2785058 RepID=A0ABR9ZVC1_9FIRM|nr:A24 family peptidase [Fusibacter ferrireducens]MBF4693855.1 prepilin peptidase [Fusibacter ferrireducens]